MKPHYADDVVTLYNGDCLDVLRELPDSSVDAVCTDPPYGLADHHPRVVAVALSAWLAGDREHVPDGRGFMARDWDRFVPPPAVWDECLRVLKPGGHLLAFAGSRTEDLMAMSIRLAGFEIRDGIDWLYASGFPKSLDVSKAIDKARDDRADINRVTGWLAAQRDRAGLTNREIDAAFGFNGMAGHWTAAPHLKIAQVPRWEQWEKLRDLIGFGDEMDAEVWRLNGRKGTPGEAWQSAEVVRVDERYNEPSGVVNVGQGEREWVARQVKAANSEDARRWSGWGTALKPAREPIVMARKPLAGTVAGNVQAYGTGALNIDACRVAHASEADRRKSEAKNRHADFGSGPRENRVYGSDKRDRGENGNYDGSAGRWPSNVVLSHVGTPDGGDACTDVCLPGCPVAELDAQSGVSASPPAGNVIAPRGRRSGSMENPMRGDVPLMNGYGDAGGASRFFPVFRYEAKAPTAERPRVDGVAHPTVKPLDLMRWLVRLVTPTGGTVLEPFAGSGTTAEACVLEGFRCIAIEREAAYLPLIVARLTKPLQPGLFGGGALTA